MASLEEQMEIDVPEKRASCSTVVGIVTNTRHILALPPEMLEQVFRHLGAADRGRAAQVCRKWRDEIHRPSMCLDDVLTLDLNNLRQRRLLGRIGQRGVRHLSVLDQPLDGLPDALRHFPDVRSLDFSISTHFSDYHLLSVVKSLARLTVLDLTFVDHITDTGVSIIARQISGLEKLKLGWCTGLTDDAMSSIGTGLSRLRSLSLSHCRITDAGIRHVAGSGTPVDPAPIPNMEHLDISSCERLTDLSLRLISSGFRRLSWLEASGGRGFTAAGFGRLSGLHCLRKLELRHTPTLDDTGLIRLAAPGTAIATLDLEGCQQLTEDGVQHLVSSVTSLRHLNLRRLVVGDVVADALSRGQSRIHTLSFHASPALTDAGLQLLATLTGLRELELGDCRHVTDAGLGHLADGRCRLETLRLRETVLRVRTTAATTGRFTDAGLAHLARMAGLTTLRLSGCRLVTGSGFRHLTDGVAPIADLQLFHGINIRDPSLRHLARMARMASLRRLTLTSCRLITENGLVHLAAAVAPLTHLTVTRCVQVGRDALYIISAGSNGHRQLSPSGEDVSAEGLLQLRHLTLDGGCVGVVGMRWAARNLLLLQSLRVSGDNRIRAVMALRTRLQRNDPYR